MKKIILKLDLQDISEKRKALKTVSALAGIDEISMDMKGKKLSIIGTVDPVSVVSKLRKFWWTEIALVGPAKEPEKKEETKKEEPKKEEPPKEEAKKEESPKEETKKEGPPKEETKTEEPKKEGEEEEEKKDEPTKEKEKKTEPQAQPYQPPAVGMVMPYRPYYPPMQTYYQVHHSIEENPNACVIC